MMQLPGATFGIVGGGQLGAMAAVAARELGCRVIVLDPDSACPASAYAEIRVAKYDDREAVRALSNECDVITIEFENLDASALRAAECPVHPSPDVLEICQDRKREKTMLRDLGIPVPTFAFLTADSSPVEIAQAASDVGFPAVVKTLRMGYDGKGQWKVGSIDQLHEAIQSAKVPVIVEAFVPFKRELSLIIARSLTGETHAFPLVENLHSNHILDLTIAPAPNADALYAQASSIATKIVNGIGLVGLLCIEFFETVSGELLVNELAPRPHNSGHWSIEGAHTSQYEQLWRALAGAPLGSTEFVAEEAAMVNLLGECWNSGEPNWNAALSVEGVHLHLYRKREARPGRKMGHLTAVGKDSTKRVLAAREKLLQHH